MLKEVNQKQGIPAPIPQVGGGARQVGPLPVSTNELRDRFLCEERQLDLVSLKVGAQLMTDAQKRGAAIDEISEAIGADDQKPSAIRSTTQPGDHPDR